MLVACMAIFVNLEVLLPNVATRNGVLELSAPRQCLANRSDWGHWIVRRRRTHFSQFCRRLCGPTLWFSFNGFLTARAEQGNIHTEMIVNYKSRLLSRSEFLFWANLEKLLSEALTRAQFFNPMGRWPVGLGETDWTCRPWSVPHAVSDMGKTRWSWSDDEFAVLQESREMLRGYDLLTTLASRVGLGG